MISGVSVRPDEAEEGDITIATNPTEVGDVYLSLATACLTRQKYLSSLPQNKEVVSIAVADPQETIRQIEEIV